MIGDLPPELEAPRARFIAELGERISTLRQSLDIKAVPYTLVLRADGTAAHAFVGRQSYDTLAGAIASVR